MFLAGGQTPTEPSCNRCGLCCMLQDKDGNITDKKCKHLVRLESGTTLCRIYNKRLGQRLDKYNVCGPRAARDVNFEGCPYNKKGEKENVDK